MGVKNSIENLARHLAANNAQETTATHLEFLDEISRGLTNLAQTNGFEASIVDAVFEYVANHHCFDLDNQDKAKTIINTVFELACPMAADDQRSKSLLLHLIEIVQRRAHVL